MIQVGTLKKLKRTCLGNDIGAVGVCYEVYRLGEHEGASFIFPNGEYCGFGMTKENSLLEGSEVDMFFDDWEGFSKETSSYNFTNVMQLSRDFDRGYFNIALGVKL